MRWSQITKIKQNLIDSIWTACFAWIHGCPKALPKHTHFWALKYMQLKLISKVSFIIVFYSGFRFPLISYLEDKKKSNYCRQLEIKELGHYFFDSSNCHVHKGGGYLIFLIWYSIPKLQGVSFPLSNFIQKRRVLLHAWW